MGKREIVCGECGQSYLRAWEHAEVCPGAKSRPEPPPLTRPVPKPTVKERIAAQADRTPMKVSRIGPNLRKEKPSTERTRRHRELHGAAYTEYRRLYMKKWRAKPV